MCLRLALLGLLKKSWSENKNKHKMNSSKIQLAEYILGHAHTFLFLCNGRNESRGACAIIPPHETFGCYYVMVCASLLWMKLSYKFTVASFTRCCALCQRCQLVCSSRKPLSPRDLY